MNIENTTEEIDLQKNADSVQKKTESAVPGTGYKDPGAAWAAENAKATGADNAENMKSAGIPGHFVMILAAILVILLCVMIYISKKPGEQKPSQDVQSGTAQTLMQEQIPQTADLSM